MNFHKVWQDIQEIGEATYNISTAEKPSTGYLVNCVGSDSTYPLPTTLDEFKTVLQKYLSGEKLHTILSNRNLFIGFLANDTHLFVGLLENIESRSEAINVALLRNEQTIYNCFTSDIIHLTESPKTIDRDIITDKKY